MGGGPGGEAFDSVRALIASGEISQDSARALLAEMASVFSGRRGGAGGGFPGSGGFQRGAQTEPGEEDAARPERERRAVLWCSS